MARITVTPEKAGAPSPSGRKLHYVGSAIFILDRLLTHYGPRDFALRLWDGTVIPPDPGQEKRFTFVLRRPSTLRRILLPPNELALGEAFLEGEWDLEGDIVAAMRLGDAFEALALSPRQGLGLARLVMALPRDPERNGQHRRSRAGEQGPPRLEGAEHSRERDRQAVAYHYDVGNDFYGLWLDRRMVYTCGYFPTGEEDLDSAQEAKLEMTCRKLRLQPGEHLLDIGCGWGGLIMYAAERYGVRALGITISRSQAEEATRRIREANLADRCRVLLVDYRDLADYGPFDKIASVGMAEQVGRAKLREYFGAAWRGLKPGGLFLNHGIAASGKESGASDLLDRYLFHRGAFIRKYVFPDGELIPVGDSLAIAERVGFEVRDVESWREHYALTLRHWVRRLEAAREEALRQVGERGFRLWRLYMAGCSHAFTTARLSVHQALLLKPGPAGESTLPRTRADLYR